VAQRPQTKSWDDWKVGHTMSSMFASDGLRLSRMVRRYDASCSTSSWAVVAVRSGRGELLEMDVASSLISSFPICVIKF